MNPGDGLSKAQVDEWVASYTARDGHHRRAWELLLAVRLGVKPSGDAESMRILDWFRRKQQEREQEEEAIDEMRRVDEPDEHVPAETYLSQTRD